MNAFTSNASLRPRPPWRSACLDVGQGDLSSLHLCLERTEIKRENRDRWPPTMAVRSGSASTLIRKSVSSTVVDPAVSEILRCVRIRSREGARVGTAAGDREGKALEGSAVAGPIGAAVTPRLVRPRPRPSRVRSVLPFAASFTFAKSTFDRGGSK